MKKECAYKQMVMVCLNKADKIRFSEGENELIKKKELQSKIEI